MPWLLADTTALWVMQPRDVVGSRVERGDQKGVVMRDTVRNALEAQDKERPYAWYVAEAAQGRIPYSADFCYWDALAERVLALFREAQPSGDERDKAVVYANQRIVALEEERDRLLRENKEFIAERGLEREALGHQSNWFTSEVSRLEAALAAAEARVRGLVDAFSEALDIVRIQAPDLYEAMDVSREALRGASQ